MKLRCSDRETVAPREADWYVFVIYGKDIPGGTDTTYSDGYFAGARPVAADVNTLVPDGYRKLEVKISRTGRGNDADCTI